MSTSGPTRDACRNDPRSPWAPVSCQAVRLVTLPFDPPIKPMLAKLVRDIPDGDFLFEPKWDGFRALVFRDGESLHIQSRELKPLERYFPELLAPLKDALPDRSVVDGEIVVVQGNELDFSTLQLRLHPAKSRIQKLSVEVPASYVAFDLLADGDEDLRAMPTEARRARLERALEAARPPVYLTPVTTDRALAADWFRRFEGAGLDGIMAKPAALAYEPNKRSMVKVKHRRTADCVAAGFRWHKDGPGTLVGSLLLGLYDADGRLQHVGVTSSFKRAQRAELVQTLRPLREGARDGHPWAAWAAAEHEAPSRKPGMMSRWSQGKDLSWEPLRVERVVEVAYDHLQDGRFRHGTTFIRWRPDRAPDGCRFDQLEVTPPFELSRIFGLAPEAPPHSDQGS